MQKIHIAELLYEIFKSIQKFNGYKKIVILKTLKNLITIKICLNYRNLEFVYDFDNDYGYVKEIEFLFKGNKNNLLENLEKEIYYE